MRAKLRGTPSDPTEVIIRDIELPLPDAYYVEFSELPEISIRRAKYTVPTNTSVTRYMYRFVGIVEAPGYSPVAEYRLVR